jgi:hypothetical protein
MENTMTETARDPRINDLIGFAVNKKPVEFQNTFNDIVTDRLAQAVDAHKEVVAKKIFGTTEEQPEPDADGSEGETTDGTDA